MCGINGILRLKDNVEQVSRDELLRTRDYLASRGPDGFGEWISDTGEIGLGHRRLAIIDLSPAGAQPMRWDDGRYQIVFNGEIYNYRELRRGLEQEGVVFRSRSDTEVIPALYAREGPAMLARLRGMYALALWDDREHRLFLARDPYGIKPLYYSIEDGYFRFASQVKALEAGGSTSRAVDPAGAVGFLLWGSVPEPRTIRRTIRALPAGHYLIVEEGQVGDPRPHHCFGHFSGPKQPTIAAALEDTVRAHLVADVPVAVFLSAGLDSSLLAALACRFLPEPPLTFTLRFDSFVGTPLDEAPLAAEISKTLGTQHLERQVGRAGFPDLWSRAVAAMDQPTIDGFNVYVVSQVAHAEGLKVALSGLGGDELFGGYSTFREMHQWMRWAQLGRGIPGVTTVWPRLARLLRPHQPKLAGFFQYGSKLPGAYFLRRGLYLPEELPGILGEDLAKEGLAVYDPMLDAGKLLADEGREMSEQIWHSVHIMESTQYMRNQLLRDADWASMAHSLEIRVPFVDTWLREQMALFSFEPARSQGKAAVAEQVAPQLPRDLWNRPKSGFFFPVMEWLQESSSFDKPRSWGRDSRQIALKLLSEFL
jgi:asparagine synthase (glutamine-hydrolysing)